MVGIPIDPSPDATLALLREGYGFVSRRCERLGADAFRTRLMLSPALCARGEPAAEVFYAPGRFTRVGAMPAITLRLLQDKGSVQLLDGPSHRHRKAMFLAILLDDDQIDQLKALIEAEMAAAIPLWTREGSVELTGAMTLVLTRAALRWTGVPPERPATESARDLAAMVEHAGQFGLAAWRALWLRAGHERQMRAVIRRIRSGELAVPETAPARMIAEHKDQSGEPLSETAAAVELINLTRPIVAIAWFAGFVAIALDRHPDWRAALREREQWLEPFVEEVRRFYPFFPMIGGRAWADFEWQGEQIAAGTWMLLDLYGTTHDPAQFPAPFDFDPARGLSWRDQSFAFIPQGGGDARETHRCPGERATVEILKVATAGLVRSLDWRLRPVGSLPMTRYPAIPKEGVVLEDLRPRNGTAAGSALFG